MKNVVIAIIVIIVAVVGFNMFNDKAEITGTVETTNETSTIQKNSDTSNVITATSSAQIETSLMPATLEKGVYAKYAGNLSQYANKKIVLFFKADWCPSCRSLDADIKASLNDIPENVVILELNYDKEGDLKKKYGVTTQHTLILVDTEGNQIKKWSGGGSLESILKQIQ